MAGHSEWCRKHWPMARARCARRTTPSRRARRSSAAGGGSIDFAHTAKKSEAGPACARPVADASSAQRASITAQPSSSVEVRSSSRESTTISARVRGIVRLRPVSACDCTMDTTAWRSPRQSFASSSICGSIVHTSARGKFTASRWRFSRETLGRGCDLARSTPLQASIFPRHHEGRGPSPLAPLRGGQAARADADGRLRRQGQHAHLDGDEAAAARADYSSEAVGHRERAAA